MSDEIKLEDLEIGQLRYYFKERDRLALEIENFVLRLYIKYKLDPEKYTLDISSGSFKPNGQVNKGT